MRIPLNTEYGILTVYIIIYASMSLQFKAHSPNFVIQLLTPAILPFPKYATEEYTEQSTNSAP